MFHTHMHAYYELMYIPTSHCGACMQNNAHNIYYNYYAVVNGFILYMYMVYEYTWDCIFTHIVRKLNSE